MKRRPTKSSKIKGSEKEKQKEKEKEKKRRDALPLRPEHGPRGIRRKPGALSQLVGSHRLSTRYMGGWMRFSELYVLEF